MIFFSSGTVVMNLAANAGDSGFDPWVGKIPWRKEMATHSSILAWKIPWTEELGGLRSMGLQKKSDMTEHEQMMFPSKILSSCQAESSRSLISVRVIGREADLSEDKRTTSQLGRGTDKPGGTQSQAALSPATTLSGGQ